MSQSIFVNDFKKGVQSVNQIAPHDQPATWRQGQGSTFVHNVGNDFDFSGFASMGQQMTNMAAGIQRDAERIQREAERQQRDAERMAEQMQRDAEQMQREAELRQRERHSRAIELSCTLRNTVVLNNGSSCKISLSKLDNGKFHMVVSSGAYNSTMAPIDGEEKIWFVVGTPVFIFRNSVFGSTSRQVINSDFSIDICTDSCRVFIQPGQPPLVIGSKGQPSELSVTTVENEYTKNLLTNPIDLSACGQITDVGLAHLKGTGAIDLSACEKITDVGLADLKSRTQADIESSQPIATNLGVLTIDLKDGPSQFNVVSTVVLNDSSSTKINLSKFENGKFCMVAFGADGIPNTIMIIEGNEIIWRIGYTSSFIFRGCVYGTKHYKISIENDKTQVCSDLNGYRMVLNALTIEELYTKSQPVGYKNQPVG